jgi:L-iditol 2-dehydrogenase
MKAAVLLAPFEFKIRELPTPTPSDNEILVKLEACGVCTLEQRIYSGKMDFPLPSVLGHEAAGKIETLGSAIVEDLHPGQKVALDLVVRCGECYYCRIGKSNLCENRFKPGQKVLGGFAEYITVKSSQVFPVPEELSFNEAAFAEPLACCIHSLKRLKVAMTEDILIVGAGVMGLLHLLAARCMGLRVTVSDPDGSRLKMAKALGADFIIDPTTTNLPSFAREISGGIGFSSCVIASPAPEALVPALDSMAKAARVNIYTAYEDVQKIPLDVNTIHRNELLVTGTEGRTQEDFFQSVRLLSFGKVDVKPLISALTSFSKIDEGFALALGHKAYRVILEHSAP